MREENDVKTQKTLVALFTLLTFVVLEQPSPQLTQAAITQASAANPDEALQRLGKILTRHGSRAVGGFIERFDVKDFSGCEITYELTPQAPPDHKGYVPFIKRIRIDLSALDPARVEIREGKQGGAAVSVATRGDEPKIETRLADEPRLFGDASRSSSHSIFLTDKKAAEGAREALVSAIELCQR